MTNVGRSLRRREDPTLLRGEGRFVADLAAAELGTDHEPCHVVFVRSPFAHAELGPIDTAGALAMPGVLAVDTAADVADIVIADFSPAFPSGMGQPLLADGRVRFVGQTVAAVVARSREEAVDAAELVEVDYKPLESVTDLAASLRGDVLLFDHLDSNVVLGGEPVPQRPIEREVMISRRLVSPRQSAAPIETRGAIAAWRGEDLHMWSSTQRPHGLRDSVCTVHHLDRAMVHVIAGPNVGGGFGGKGGVAVEELLLPRLARLVDQPVRWIDTRSEYQTAAQQSRGEVVTVDLAGSADGQFESINVHIIKDCGAFPVVGAGLPQGYSRPITTGPYAIPEAEFSFVSVVTNAPPVAAFRGAGRAPIIHAIECAVDAYAVEIGMDPAELRQRNLVRPEQMPYETPMGSIYDEADYPADLATVMELAGYVELRRDQTARRANRNGLQLGVGVIAYNHITNGAGGEEASVTVQPDGSAVVVTGSTDQGHGHDMAWAQIASDVLAIPMDRIVVREGHTDEVATGVGAVGSRSLQTAGMAVHQSAEAVVERARALAADHFEAAVGDVMLDSDTGSFTVVGTPSVSATWSELAVLGLGDPERELVCGEVFAGPNTYPSGSHIAVVELDPDTGMVDVVGYFGVDDAGRRVNPVIVEGQLHGGIAAGLGQALCEVVAFDDAGNPITASFMDYALPTADLLPNFELAPAAVASSFNSQGFKGVGESGTVAAAPAVHLAVLDALRPFGVTHLDMPCTPLRVWDALRGAASADRDAADPGLVQ